MLSLGRIHEGSVSRIEIVSRTEWGFVLAACVLSQRTVVRALGALLVEPVFVLLSARVSAGGLELDRHGWGLAAARGFNSYSKTLGVYARAGQRVEDHAVALLIWFEPARRQGSAAIDGEQP